jgi:dTDP-4-amino-4,6-dideoxygalactose transaminase
MPYAKHATRRRDHHLLLQTNVPFVDLKAQYDAIRSEVWTAMEDVLSTTSFVMGPALDRFEEAFARYNGAAYCIGVGSGTAALSLALQALDIGEGDEVIVPANTYIATALAVSATGARPVLVDVCDDYLIDVEAIERAVTPRTRAIMPVHLYGQVVPMEPVLDVARRHGLRVVEDACQAHGARWNGRRAGTFGDLGCYSFYPGKNLGCYGDGGAIVTNDRELYERLRLLRDFGQREKYVHLIKGGNSRLDTLQAAVLNVKLQYIDAWNERRRSNARLYDELLRSAGFPVPQRLAGGEHVYHLYVTQVNDRDAVRAKLAESGVATGIHYPIPIHRQRAYADLGYGEGSFPVTEAAAPRLLSLPMYPELSEEQIRYVADMLAEVAS